MPTITKQSDADVALAALVGTVQAALPSVTALAALQVPEQTFTAAVSSAASVAQAETLRKQILATMNGIAGRGASIVAALKPLLPTS